MSRAPRRRSRLWAAWLAALWLCAAPLAAREPAPVTETRPAEGAQAVAVEEPAVEEPAVEEPAVDAPAVAAVPKLTGPVVDLTGTLDAAAVARLGERSLELQRRKGAQVMLLMLDSTGGEDIGAYAGRVFAQWQPGRAGIDDGVLVVVAKRDRRMRIHLGRGLEATIPDDTAQRVIDEILAPAFRDEDYAGGLERAYDALIGLIDGTPLPEPRSGGGMPWPFWIFVGAICSPFVLIPLFGMRAAWRHGPAAFFGRLGIIAAVVVGTYVFTAPKTMPQMLDWEQWMPMALLTYIVTAFLSVSAFAGPGLGGDASDDDDRDRRERRRSSSSSSSSSSSDSGSYSGGGGGSDGGGASGRW